MKVLIVHYRFFISGGPERYMFNLIEALKEKGIEVITFSLANINNVAGDYNKYFAPNIGNSNEIFVDKYPKKIGTYIDLFSREFYSFKVKKKLEKLIKDTKPDVCYLLAYKRSLSYSVIDACNKYNIPIVNRISDYNTICGNGSLYRKGEFCDLCLKSDENCFKYKCIKNNYIFSLIRYLSIKYRKIKKIDEKISTYVCTNKFMYNMMEKYGYSKNKLKIIPTFFKDDPELNKIKKENIVEKNKIEFLFIGNIDETKGIYDLLNALKELVKVATNFHLTIVGGLHEEEIESVKNIVTENKLNNFVDIFHFVRGKEIYDFYLKTNVTIIPTRWVENLPNTLIESLYFNRPCVVPNFGSFMYTVNDSVSYKFKPLDFISLANKLEYICKNPDSIINKSKKCEEYFNKYYIQETHIIKLVELFKEVLK